MNNTINQMRQRSSIRSFDNVKKIPQEDLELILEAVQQSPTYINAQQCSVIVIDKPEDRKLMLEFTKGSGGHIQQHIEDCSTFLLFVMDFNKVDRTLKYELQNLEITNYFESLMIGTVDVGIATEAATVAAESLGLGTVMIGAVRRSSKQIIEHFNLPPLTFPILGLCIGYAKEEGHAKPRLAKESFVHYDKYTQIDWEKTIQEYNEVCLEYYKKNYGVDFKWSQFVSSFYNKGYWEDLSSVYKDQKFDLK